MTYVADMTEANSLVGNGQCVTVVHAVVTIPPTSAWHRGELVKDAAHISPGTIIATFDNDGRYGNHTNGTSHAAVFLRQTAVGLVVLDQWKGHAPRPDHPPQERTIRFNHAGSLKVDQGENYYVVQQVVTWAACDEYFRGSICNSTTSLRMPLVPDGRPNPPFF